MQRARSFLYVSLGILALALAYHLGASTATAQVANVAVGRYQLYQSSYEVGDAGAHTMISVQSVMRIDTATGTVTEFNAFKSADGVLHEAWIPTNMDKK
jgi:hypothetical protein